MRHYFSSLSSEFNPSQPKNAFYSKLAGQRVTLTKSDQRKIDKLYNFNDESTVSQLCCSNKEVELHATYHYGNREGLYEQQSYTSLYNGRYQAFGTILESDNFNSFNPLNIAIV